MRAASMTNVGIRIRRFFREEAVIWLLRSSIPAAAMRELILLTSLE